MAHDVLKDSVERQTGRATIFIVGILLGGVLVLLSYIADMGADMLVAGGYGHSRLREALFGGVTRTLLSSQTLPLFMSH